MTRDLDTLLRDADPLRARSDDDSALLAAARARVDRNRDGAVVVLAARRPHWRRRVALVAAAAAVLTAVPLVLSAVLDDDSPTPVLTVAVAADGSIQCGSGYAAPIDTGDAAVRLLPDVLPDGWSYTRIFARDDTQHGWCVPPSLTALRQDAQGQVTGRISVVGPISAPLDQAKVDSFSTPDTLNGHPARRFDGTIEFPAHRWMWTDDRGQVWEAEASGMPLNEGRQALAAVSTDGPQVSWDGDALPEWTLVHLREGAPYGPDPRRLQWYVELSDGSGPRNVDVSVSHGDPVPLLAGVGVGERVTSVGGKPAVLGRPRGGEDAGGPPGSVPTTPVLVEVAPGTVAWSWAAADELPEVQAMLESLRQVSATDPRLEQFGTD